MTLNIRTSPPFNRLPSEDDLSDLPVWGVVALASRIAERIEPVVISAFSHYPKKYLSLIRRVRVWTARSAASAGNAPILKGLQGARREFCGVADEILDIVGFVSDANQGKTSDFGHSIIDTARFATLRLITLADELSASALVDGVLQDVGALRDRHAENIANPHRAIRPAQLGDLWPSGEPVRVFEDRLRIFLHKQHIDALKRHFQHEYDSGYSWSMLFWLPRHAAFAFCIRALWSLDHLVGKRLGRYQHKELEQVRSVIEQLRRGCSSGAPVACPDIKDGRRIFCLTKPRSLTHRTDKGEILCALLKCATYHLLFAGESLQSRYQAMGRSMGLVLLSLQYDGSDCATTLRREIDKDFFDILKLSHRMPWNDNTGCDPAEIARLRKEKNAEARFIPRGSDIERAIILYNRKYGEHGAKLEKRCVFCGKPPTNETNEDVIPKWLRRLTKSSGKFVSVRTRGGKIVKRLFSSYKFAACEVCNVRFGKNLENKMRDIFLHLSDGRPIIHANLALVLDWMDKVRIGTWVGELMRRDNCYRILPKFHIQDRIGTTDRILIISRCASEAVHLSFEPQSDPLFMQVPSFFMLCANNIAIVSVSSLGVASRLLGVPFLSPRSEMHDGRIESQWMPSLALPVKERLTFLDSRFSAVAQVILPERPATNNPYRAEIDRVLENDSNRSRVHVVTEGQITRLGQTTPFQLTSTIKSFDSLQMIIRTVLDEARRWVLHSSPPPFLTDDDKLNRSARRHHFDRLKLAELGHSCCRLD